MNPLYLIKTYSNDRTAWAKPVVSLRTGTGNPSNRSQRRCWRWCEAEAPPSASTVHLCCLYFDFVPSCIASQKWRDHVQLTLGSVQAKYGNLHDSSRRRKASLLPIRLRQGEDDKHRNYILPRGMLPVRL